MIYAKKVKRKCSVRGCRNTECFAISRSRELGNSVILCKNCLEEALDAVGGMDAETKSNIPAPGKTEAPSLFFNAAIKNAGKVPAQSPLEAEEWICPECKRIYKTEKGYVQHVQTCKKGKDGK